MGTLPYLDKKDDLSRDVLMSHIHIDFIRRVMIMKYEMIVYIREFTAEISTSEFFYLHQELNKWFCLHAMFCDKSSSFYLNLISCWLEKLYFQATLVNLSITISPIRFQSMHINTWYLFSSCSVYFLLFRSPLSVLIWLGNVSRGSLPNRIYKNRGFIDIETKHSQNII